MGVLKFRVYSRVEVEMPIHIVSQGKKKPIAAHLSNLSEEGAALIYTSPIRITHRINFEMPLPKVEQPVLVRADVLWVRPIMDDGQQVFAHGLLFNRIGYEDRQRIRVFISQNADY
ncbi:PilZ domain-containing protein [bacterium]|nr:PilZ domain-containing protein [bacterium]